MEITVASQLTVFLFAIILGAFLCLVFDVFRIFNVILKLNLKRIFFEDVIYFVLSAFITFIYILVVNSGEIRFYIIWGEIIGWILYRVTVGKFIYKLTLKIAKFFAKCISKIKKYIMLKIPKNKIRKVIEKLKPNLIKKSSQKKKVLQKIHNK